MAFRRGLNITQTGSSLKIHTRVKIAFKNGPSLVCVSMDNFQLLFNWTDAGRSPRIQLLSMQKIPLRLGRSRTPLLGRTALQLAQKLTRKPNRTKRPRKRSKLLHGTHLCNTYISTPKCTQRRYASCTSHGISIGSMELPLLSEDRVSKIGGGTPLLWSETNQETLALSDFSSARACLTLIERRNVHPLVVMLYALMTSLPFHRKVIHLAVVACLDRVEETLVMLKSAVIMARSRLRFHIFADDANRPKFTTQVRTSFTVIGTN